MNAAAANLMVSNQAGTFEYRIPGTLLIK